VYSQNGPIQSIQTGGQWYCDTSLFSIPWSIYFGRKSFGQISVGQMSLGQMSTAINKEEIYNIFTSRPPYMSSVSSSASTPGTLSTNATTYRHPQQRQNSFTSSGSGSGSAVRRNHPPDPVPKSKIVSPYIVSVDTSENGYLTPTESPTSPDQLSTSSDPHGSKFSRMPQPRFRQQPPPAPQKRPGTKCNRVEVDLSDKQPDQLCYGIEQRILDTYVRKQLS